MEFWKDIQGFEGRYQISSWGNVRSVGRLIVKKNGAIMETETCQLKAANCKGYLFVALSINDKQKLFQIHRLVANAFILNPENKPEVNHKDLNPRNNSISNLEWVTSSENKMYSKKMKSFFQGLRG